MSSTIKFSLRLWIAVLFTIIILVVGVDQIRADIALNSLTECSNEVRSQNNVEALSISPLLEKAAQKKAEDMKLFKYWAHRNPITGMYAWKFIKNEGYQYQIAGENLAIGFQLGQQICDAWEQSQSHFDNLVNPNFKEVGFAKLPVELNDQKGVLVVQLLGGREEITPSLKAQYLSASLLQGQGQKAGSILFLILSLTICRIGVRYLRRLTNE